MTYKFIDFLLVPCSNCIIKRRNKRNAKRKGYKVKRFKQQLKVASRVAVTILTIGYRWGIGNYLWELMSF